MKVPFSPVGETTPASTALRGPSGQGGTEEAFGAGIGRGLARVGQSLDGLTTYMQQKQEQTQRFNAMARLSDFETELQDQMIERGRAYDPSTGGDFTQDIKGVFTTKKDQFIASLPQNLRAEFGARVEAIGQNLHGQAMKVQIDAMDNFAKLKLSDAYDKARIALDQDGSVGNLDSQRALLYGLLDQSGLSVAEKMALKRQFDIGIESASYKSEARKGKVQLDALGVGSGAQAGAFVLLQEFMPHVTEDEAKATASLAETVAKSQVKPEIWAAQNDPTKAALLSLIADNGKLPLEVINALQSGGDVAKAVEDLGGDRRKAEAAVIRGDALLPSSEADADPRYENIPYEDRLALRADAEREATADATAQAAAQKAQNASLINALQVGLNDGTAGQADIDALRGAGILTDIDAIRKSQEILDKRTADIQLAAQGQEMLRQGVTFNPNDTDHVKIENALVGKEGMQALQNQDTQYAANTLVPMVQQMQDIPPDVAGLLTGMVRSEDQNKAIWALDLLSQLQEVSPKGYDARTTSAVASDVALWQSAKDYYPQDKLFEIMRGGDTQEQRVRTEALRKEAKSLLADSTKGPTITGDVLQQLGVSNGLFGAGQVNMQALPWAAQGAMAEFSGLFEAEYARVGNADLAKKNALTLLKKDWGVTSVGGGHWTLMKFPPEKIYPPIDGKYDWITQQGTADLKLQPGETFQLVADEVTRTEIDQWRQGGPAPSYRAVILDKAGVWRMFDPWVPGADRLYFDTKPVLAQQAEEWLKKRADMQRLDSARTLGEALRHEQETGTPIPQDVVTDNIGPLEEWQRAENAAP